MWQCGRGLEKCGVQELEQGLTVVNGRVSGLPELFAVHWKGIKVPEVFSGGDWGGG